MKPKSRLSNEHEKKRFGDEEIGKELARRELGELGLNPSSDLYEDTGGNCWQ